jgi:hypothetical protein
MKNVLIGIGLIGLMSCGGSKSPKDAAVEWCECVAKHNKEYGTQECKDIQENFIKENKGKDDVLKEFFVEQENCRASIINKKD